MLMQPRGNQRHPGRHPSKKSDKQPDEQERGRLLGAANRQGECDNLQECRKACAPPMIVICRFGEAAANWTWPRSCSL